MTEWSAAEESLHGEMTERLDRRPWPARPLQAEVRVSFEFFPPATEVGGRRLHDVATRLVALDPAFVSVTYGAGGSTQSRTHDSLESLAAIAPRLAGHITCVGATRQGVHGVLDAYRSIGVRRVVALRGDDPGDGRPAVPAEGFADAAALVAAIRDRTDGSDWDISVAGYPEVHPKADSSAADVDSLRRKVDAGADRVLTQFFFDNESFLRFHERCRAAGISVPIVPGIMPVGDFDKVSRFGAGCGATIPEWMPQLFEGLAQAPDVHRLVAATVAAEQCRHLAEHGIGQFHFYTMNAADLTEATCRMLGVTPAAGSASVSDDLGDDLRDGTVA